MFEKFTEKAKRVLFLARYEASQSGSKVIGTEHILLGLLKEGEEITRELFSRSIHGKSVAYVTRYWHRLIFAGRDIPPRQVDSNAAVIDFVKANHGAIGYVDTGTPLVSDVKVIAVDERWSGLKFVRRLKDR